MPTPRARARTLAVVLAGGAGGRMDPLTRRRAKPALPFAGTHRLIDFPLSNCANSGISDVWVVQQYLPHALEDHLANGRPWDLDRTRGGLLLLHPFTGGEEGGFHRGNADSLWRYRQLIAEFDADVVLVLSADAVYTLDYRDVVDAHLAHDADVTMVTTRVDEDASRFGVVDAADDGRVRDFWYKPDEPPTDLVTIEVFAYRPSALAGTLERLADEDGGLADFGDALLPALVSDGRAFEHRFEGYWRDVGTPDSYWQAHRDLLDGVTGIDLDDRRWPVRTTSSHRQPARFGADASVEHSMVAPGCVVEGRVVRSVLGPGVVVEKGAVVDSAVVLNEAVVRSGARVERCVVDLHAEVTAGASVGGGAGVTVFAPAADEGEDDDGS
jgi:glucose-1-phosphate adenylyltransferase